MSEQVVDALQMALEARAISALSEPKREWFILGRTENDAINRIFESAGWVKEVVKDGEGDADVEIRYLRPAQS